MRNLALTVNITEGFKICLTDSF